MVQAATGLGNASRKDGLRRVLLRRRGDELFAEGMLQLDAASVAANPTGGTAGVGRDGRLRLEGTVGVLQHQGKVGTKGAEGAVGRETRVYVPKLLRQRFGRFWDLYRRLKCIHGVFLDDGC